MKSKFTILATLLILSLFPTASSYSRPIARQPDSTYQTGVQTILSTAFTSTAEVAYSIPYTSVMTTSSLNASLGIYGVSYQMISGSFGWKHYVSSITTSTLSVHAAVFSAASSIYYLKLCYIITSNTNIDMNYVEYTFDGK